MKIQKTLFAGIFIFILLIGGLFAQTQQDVGFCSGDQLGIKELAPWYCTSINQVVYNEYQQWLPVAMAVMMASFSIAAIIFVFGIALKNQRVREFGVGELYEATASAIILALFMMIAAVMLGLIPASFTGPLDPYVTSLNYISTTITQTNTFVAALFNTYYTASYFQSFSLNVNVNVPAGNQKYLSDTITNGLTKGAGIFKSVSPIYSAAIEIFFIFPSQVIVYLLMDGLLVLHVQYFMLIFGMYAAIPVFLLPGIILRSFVPTRSLGGMFIGVAVGFFFIMPVMFSISYYFTHSSVANALTLATQQMNQYSQGVGSQQNAISPTSPLVTTLTNVQNSMGAFWLAVLFYPALIVALTYFSVITIADFIGGFAHSSRKFIGQL